jgi:hypothetical protein
LPDLVEDHEAAPQQDLAVGRHFHATRRAVQQGDAQHVLHFRDRL